MLNISWCRPITPTSNSIWIPGSFWFYPWLLRGSFRGLEEKAETLKQTGPWEFVFKSQNRENESRGNRHPWLEIIWDGRENSRASDDDTHVTPRLFYTRARGSYYVFTSLKRKKTRELRTKVGSFCFVFSAEGYLTSCVVLFTVNWGGRIEREEKCMSRLNEIVQRDLSAGTLFGTLVREMREWLRNGHPPKSDGENQFSKKIATKFHFQRGREISHRKSLDGNRWEAEPKPKFDQAMRTSTGVQN